MALGVLLDTLIVRSVLVTALNLDLGGKIWWPSNLDRNGHAVEPPGRGQGAGVRGRSDERRTRSSGWAGGIPRPTRSLPWTRWQDEVTPQQVRRALARAERGAALDVAEATALLAATGDDLDRLCAAAARVRDAGLGRPDGRAW